MFSIAAINDTNSRGKWEPLAPTKEAQEFHLSQAYHEGLLKLQAKDYEKAREVFEAVLKDPIISSPQVGISVSDSHLLQLRFLTLKNLAAVFLEQGPAHYKNALQCYIQAVEIDSNDSVVWNQLGTLSCSMGLLSTSRWAFEQGLLCSPNNWNCMEKLLEILIAIGDEVACLSVVDLILRHWPSHSRALHVKKTIENVEQLPFTPRGIDKLAPKHVRLKFPDKRKAHDGDESGDNAACKRHHKSLELNLTGASWAAIADAILSIFLSTSRKDSEAGFIHHDALNAKSDDSQENTMHCDSYSNEGCLGPQTYEKIGRYTHVDIGICLSSTSEIAVDAEGKIQKALPVGENTSPISYKFEETSTPREKENCADKEHPQERRSTRLERLRSRKSGKVELEFSNIKDLGKVVFRYLEPFVLNNSSKKSNDCSGSSCVLSSDILKYANSFEYKDVVRFLSKSSKNCGIYHISHLLLEEVSHLKIPFQDTFVKFLELEKLTRHWGQDRTPLCSLFLAELYYDQGSLSGNDARRSELFSESSYHLCKVVEMVALDASNNLADMCGPASSKIAAPEVNDYTNSAAKVFDNVCTTKYSGCQEFSRNVCRAKVEDTGCQDVAEHDLILTNDSIFWVRFFWLSGRLSRYSGSKEKALKELRICLSLLENAKTTKERPNSVFLPHCKIVRSLTVGIIRYEINLLNLDTLLGMTVQDMIKDGLYAKCIDLLSPLLLPNTGVYFEILSSASKESERAISLELSALDILMTACEKSEPLNVEVYLNCHRRKLQILTVAAGILDSFELNNVETISTKWMHMVAEDVKDISRVVSQTKSAIDQMESYSSYDSLNSIASEIQTLLLTVMCDSVRKVLHFNCSSSGTSNHIDQSDGWCLVDAAIAFCKLQHLDQNVAIKIQVDLIVVVHDLLAEYGLCCAGRDTKGEEGLFLKFAIKHLLALDMKLKSLTGGTSLKEESASLHNCASEGMTPDRNVNCEEQDKDVEGCETRNNVVEAKANSVTDPSEKYIDSDIIRLVGDVDMEKVELYIDNALDQSFFCLYGLNINPDSSSEDDLAVHKNTSRGDYQTKEQCADVFQYILPYARALSRGGLIKLRRVFRAIRKHFPQPPDEILAENAIEKILDSPDLCEDKLPEVPRFNGNWEPIMNLLFPDGRVPGKFKALSTVSSMPYFEVYGNLYYLIAQSEETSATDKYAGFVLRKEGEEFVEQSANLFKYDLLYNPLRFESWQKLANLYDEEVDLLLNDGSKHINVVDWRQNTTLPQRVEIGRQRSRRCLLISLVLAKTPIQQSQIHELLALVYYDSLQNVVPFYDQRSIVPKKDTAWMEFSRNSMKYFEEAFALKPEWLHAFYLGKLSEKLGYSPEKSFSYYGKAASLNPSAVDPVYRMHASRLKLLYTQGKQNLNILQIVAAYSFNQSTKDAIFVKLGWTNQDLMEVDVQDECLSDDLKVKRNTETHLLDEAWNILYDDCISALETCVEGELKHYHKARYMLAQGLYKRGAVGDLERARDELSFCFKSSRSSFTINIWEIDGSAKRARRKNPGHGDNRRNLELSLSESSRKFITCIRKYILLYLNLLEKTGDLLTLERAYAYLRTDKRFSLCLGDVVPVGLGKYIQSLVSSIRNAENLGATNNTRLEHMLEKMFNIFMDHANLWAEISSLPEVNNPDLSESNLYGYIHQYIHMLESDARLEALEGINEKMRKRFKSPKLANSNFSKIFKHASLAWCRCILTKLVSITPLPDSEHPKPTVHSETGLQLFVDLQPDEFLSSSTEGPYSKGLDLNLYQVLSRLKNVRIQQVSEENLEGAATLMRCTYNYYRDSSCGAVPSGINLYTVFFPSHPPDEGLQQLDQDRVEVLDLSIPRKLLLWVYTLVHGRYSNISAVVKYCEEHAKSRMRRGAATSSSVSQANISVSVSVSHAGSVVKEKSEQDEHMEADDNLSASPSPHQDDTMPGSSNVYLALSAQLNRCNTTKGEN